MAVARNLWFDIREAVLYAVLMAHYSSDFVKIVALIAAKACSSAWWPILTPEQAVDFAWFSVNCDGDAAEDDDDLRSHFALWVESKQA